MARKVSETSEEQDHRDRVLVLRDAAGNIYLIPAKKVPDGLVKESAKARVEAEIKKGKSGEDYSLVGTYEMATDSRRAAYARPRVEFVTLAEGTS